jgi:predicted glutamine amidotransferase
VTFVAHVRYATAGNRALANTMDGRIMAHNRGFGETARLEEQLGRYRELVQGDADSERYFALITQQIDAHGGDAGAGIAAAARWIGEQLPLSSLNVIVATAEELRALRYPGQHALHIIERPAGVSSPPAPNTPAAAGSPATTGTPPGTAATGLHARSTTSPVHAPGLHMLPSVVVASEQPDGEHGWRMLASGELATCVPT